MKETLKAILKLSPIALSKNHLYDIQTKKIIKSFLKPGSNTIDVGCHKGEILDLMLKAAPQGTHYGFEPIPMLFDLLKIKYKSKTNCKIIDIALSNKKGKSSFNYVVSNPSYSGLIKRAYDKEGEKDTLIEVKTDLLDDIVSEDTKIDMIKIDVEGGELLVLEGAKRLIKREKPLVIFEHGLGASDFYGSSPDMIFNYFSDCKMKIASLSHFLKKKPAFDLEEFEEQFYQKKNYYFVAYP